MQSQKNNVIHHEFRKPRIKTAACEATTDVIYMEMDDKGNGCVLVKHKTIINGEVVHTSYQLTAEHDLEGN